MAEKKVDKITLAEIEKEMAKGLTQKQAIARLGMGTKEKEK